MSSKPRKSIRSDDIRLNVGLRSLHGRGRLSTSAPASHVSRALARPRFASTPFTALQTTKASHRIRARLTADHRATTPKAAAVNAPRIKESDTSRLFAPTIRFPNKSIPRTEFCFTLRLHHLPPTSARFNNPSFLSSKNIALRHRPCCTSCQCQTSAQTVHSRNKFNVGLRSGGAAQTAARSHPRGPRRLT
ncbi:hypothetical protein TRVL_04731 [Trypanosoma vivax]|nr:hypothetical protein TRVL_04731 [Trypanosoma vivax]